jgi:hypothetical protein
MANRISTLFDFKEQGSGLSKIKSDITEADGAIGKMKAGWKSALTEFGRSPAAMASAGAAIGVFAAKAVNDASTLEESVNAVNVTFGQAADEVLAIGENSAKSFGLSKAEFNSMAVQFSSFANTVTGPGGDVAATLNDLTTRAADFASVMNLDVAEAARVFQSGLAGETEPLKKFGIDLSAAAVDAYALEEGLVRSKSEMTEAIKVQARYGLLMQETSKTQGDFANTSDSLANQQRILKATMTDMSAEVGGVLIPQLSELAGQIQAVADVAQKVKGPLEDAFELPGLSQAAQLAEFNLDMLVNPIGTIKGLMGDAGTAAELAAEGLGEFSTAARGAASGGRELADETDGVRDASVRHAEALARATEKSEYFGVALGTLDGELRAIRGNSAAAADGMDEMAEPVDEAAERVAELEEAFEDLEDQISDRSAWRDVQDSIDDFTEAVEAAEAAEEEFGAGSREAAGAWREAEAALDSRKQSVIDYIKQVEGIPPEQVTDIRAMLNRGDVDAAEAALAQLERERTTRINITTYYRQQGSQSAPIVQPSTDDINRFDTGGIVPGPRGKPQLAIVHGGETVLPTHKSSPVSTTSTSGSSLAGGVTLVLAPQGNIYGDEALRRTLDEFGASVERMVNDPNRAARTTAIGNRLNGRA